VQTFIQTIKQLRADRGLSLRGLAEAAGLSASALSQIEAGQVSPSVATLEKIATALGVSITALFAVPETSEGPRIVSLAGQPTYSLGDAVHFTPLGHKTSQATFEPVHIRLDPGGSFSDRPYTVSEGEEFVWVRHGSVVLVLDDHEHRIDEMHGVAFDPARPHNWINPGEQPVELILIRPRPAQRGGEGGK